MRLRVISFNIRCKDDPNGNSIKERAPRLKYVISKYSPDIIGFQEYTPAWKSHIEHYFGDEYDIFNKYRTMFIKRESSPILWKKSKFKCLDKGYFWLSDTPDIKSKGWDEKYNCYRICEYVILYDICSCNKFTFMNTHLGFGDIGQVKSVNLIREFSVNISHYPTLVTGDFNMQPTDVAYKEVTKYFIDTNVKADSNPTYHGYNPDSAASKHIDYCFCDNRIEPISYKIINDLCFGKFPSDHYGVCADVKI